ncbi:MAG: adenosylmethionine decarboxylase [Vulcanococcus sp.]
MNQTIASLHPNPGWLNGAPGSSHTFNRGSAARPLPPTNSPDGASTDTTAPVGKHCILELYNCNPSKLDDEDVLRRTITAAVNQAGATLLHLITHQFQPQGVTGLALLAESHLSIHTWPESGYAAVDVFTCGDHTMPERACEQLCRDLESSSHSLRSFRHQTPPQISQQQRLAG